MTCPEVLVRSHHEAEDPSFHNIAFSVTAKTHYQTPVRLLRTDEEEPSCVGTENDPLLDHFSFFFFFLMATGMYFNAVEASQKLGAICTRREAGGS